MDQPIVFNQILPEDKFNEVSNLFNFGEWRLSNVSDISKTNGSYDPPTDSKTSYGPDNQLESGQYVPT